MPASADNEDADTGSATSSPLSAMFVVVCNACENFDIRLDGSMTVRDARALITSKLGSVGRNATIKLSLRGIQLLDDNATLQQLAPSAVFRDQERLHVSVAVGGELRAAGADLPKGLLANSRREEDVAQREQARMMEPMIDMMVRNPQFVDSMFASQPEVQAMMRSNPEMARELRNPEVLKNMILSQIDPDQKRQMSRTMQLQMAQIANIPGGSAMLERHMNKFLQQPAGKRTRADLQDATEEHSRPDDHRQFNAEALPNPWSRAATSAPRNPLGLGVPYSAPTLTSPPPLRQTTPPHGEFLRLLSSLEPRSGAAAASTAPPQPPPARREFPEQLDILLDMGFEDLELCQEALDVCNGDVDAAVCYMAERLP